MSYKPTQGMVEEAARGLEWREAFGRGGTEVGVARARDIVNERNLSEDTVKRMFSFFSRHEVDKEAEGFRPGEEGYPSAGRIAWALWGGDAGFSWSRNIVESLDEERVMDDRNDPEISDAVEKNLREQAEEHNKDVNNAASKRTNYRTLAAVFRRGVGAYYTNPESVRPSVNSPEQWAYARVSSFRYALRNGSFRSGKHDTDLLPEGHPMSSKRQNQEEMETMGMSEESRPYPNEHAARINDPDKYEEFRRENDAGGEGIHFIYGIFMLEGERTSEIQSIRFDDDMFTPESAMEWLSDNDYDPIMFEEAIEERIFSRHIVEITEDDDSIIIKFGKGEMFEGINVMPEEVVEEEMEQQRFDRRHLVKREMEVDRKYIDEETRRASVVISTENPVERAFGNEVLDHSDRAINLSWFGSGRAPLLLDHDMTKQIGVVESVELDSAGRELRAQVRFSRNAQAEEVFQDVVDGIRTSLSVGYQVDRMEKESDGTFRVVQWTPMEASFVSIPADSQSRVGRSAEAPQTDEKAIESVKETEMTDTVDVQAVSSEATANARKEASKIVDLGARHNRSDLAREALASNRSYDEFKGMLLDAIGDQPLKNEDIGMSKSEVKRFNLMRAVNAMANPSDRRAQEEAAYEFEVSAAAQQRSGRAAKGLMIPTDILKSWNQRTINAQTDDTALIPEEFRAGDFIDVLRNSSSVMQAGATMLQGLEGNVAIPRKSGASSAAIITTEGGLAAESEPTFDQVTMTPKTLGAYTDITRQMMVQSSPDIEALVRDDLTSAMALEIDRLGLYGSGSNGQPTGINAALGAGQKKDFANDTPSFAEIVDMETILRSANALIGNPVYIMQASSYGPLKTTEKATDTAQFIVEPDGRINGYDVIVSNQVGSRNIFFGNFADLLIGMYGGLDLLVDPYTNSRSGTVRIRVLQSFDLALRHVESFVLGDEGIS